MKSSNYHGGKNLILGDSRRFSPLVPGTIAMGFFGRYGCLVLPPPLCDNHNHFQEWRVLSCAIPPPPPELCFQLPPAFIPPTILIPSLSDQQPDLRKGTVKSVSSSPWSILVLTHLIFPDFISEYFSGTSKPIHFTHFSMYKK